MFLFFDNNVPRPLKRYLPGHLVRTAYEMRWTLLENGDLLAAVERARFDVFITADQNLSYQQNLQGRSIALVILGAGRWTLVKPHRERVVAIVNAAVPGSYALIDIPLPPKPRRIASE